MTMKKLGIWSPTANLRFERRDLRDGEYYVINPKRNVLQQLWRSDEGAEQWRDVPVVQEQTQTKNK